MHQPDKSPAPVPAALARVHALQRDRRSRDASRQFWIEGFRQFIQALDAGFAFDAIVHSRVLLKSADLRERVRRLVAAGVAEVRVTPEQFRSVSRAEHASGIGAIARQRWTPLPRADATRGIGWLVLERVRSSGNLGTVLRTAAATGVAGIILLDHATDPYDPQVVRASMGGVFHLDLVRTTYGRLRQWANARGVRLVALTPHGDDLWTHDTTAPSSLSRVALMIGEERQGLSPRALSIADEKIRLPMTGRADSLNLGVAAGVMMYELVRRRTLAAAATATPR